MLGSINIKNQTNLENYVSKLFNFKNLQVSYLKSNLRGICSKQSIYKVVSKHEAILIVKHFCSQNLKRIFIHISIQTFVTLYRKYMHLCCRRKI